MSSDNNMHLKEDMLLQHIRKSIDERIKQIADEEFTKAKENIEKYRAEVIAGTLLYIQRQIEFERMGEKIIISVKDEHKI